MPAADPRDTVEGVCVGSGTRLGPSSPPTKRGGVVLHQRPRHHISFKDEAVKKRLFITVGTVVKSVETKSAAEAIPATPLFIMRYAYVVGSG